jgi:hypothetical protein
MTDLLMPLPAGTVQVICVFSCESAGQDTPPTVTTAPLVPKLEPAIVKVLPPAVDPLTGAIELIVGGLYE